MQTPRAYDPRSLKRLASVVLNAISLLATYTLWRVFPLDFGSDVWNDLARYALLLVMVVTVIAAIVEAVQAVSISLSRRGAAPPGGDPRFTP